MRNFTLYCALAMAGASWVPAHAGLARTDLLPVPQSMAGQQEPFSPEALQNRVPAAELHFAQFRQKESEATIRVNQLEEQIRALNGQIEEMNFQLLQLQEQIRRMQEDNEFRFQELEGKRGGVDPANRMARQPEEPPGKQQPSEQESAQRADGDLVARNQEEAAPQGRTIDGVEIFDRREGSGEEEALQPGVLGSLTFDEKGNIVDSQIEKPIDLTSRLPRSGQDRPAAVPPPANDTPQITASVPSQFPDDPDQLYDLGYGYVQSGDYKLAEDVFGEFSSRYPDSPKAAEASFWLGESLLAQGQYENAARVLLDAHKKHPESRMGAQTLLKLGVSLAGMNQRELACATYAEVPQKYPDLSNAVREKLAAEQKAASC